MTIIGTYEQDNLLLSLLDESKTFNTSPLGNKIQHMPLNDWNAVVIGCKVFSSSSIGEFIREHGGTWEISHERYYGRRQGFICRIQHKLFPDIIRISGVSNDAIAFALIAFCQELDKLK